MKFLIFFIGLLFFYICCVILYSLISNKSISESAAMIRNYIKKFFQDFFMAPEVELVNDPILMNHLVSALKPYSVLKTDTDCGYSYYGAEKLPILYVQVISKKFAEDWPEMQSIVAQVFKAYMVTCGYTNVPFEVSFQEKVPPDYYVFILYGTTQENREKIAHYRSIQAAASRKAAVYAARPFVDDELEEELKQEALRNECDAAATDTRNKK